MDTQEKIKQIATEILNTKDTNAILNILKVELQDLLEQFITSDPTRCVDLLCLQPKLKKTYIKTTQIFKENSLGHKIYLTIQSLQGEWAREDFWKSYYFRYPEDEPNPGTFESYLEKFKKQGVIKKVKRGIFTKT